MRTASEREKTDPSTENSGGTRSRSFQNHERWGRDKHHRGATSNQGETTADSRGKYYKQDVPMEVNPTKQTSYGLTSGPGGYFDLNNPSDEEEAQHTPTSYPDLTIHLQPYDPMTNSTTLPNTPKEQGNQGKEILHRELLKLTLSRNHYSRESELRNQTQPQENRPPQNLQTLDEAVISETLYLSR